MGKLRMAIRAYARESLPPVQILRRVNTLLRDIHERSTATLWIGLYNPAEHEVVFANAGHVPPLLVDASEGARFLEDVHGPPIGAVDGATYGESRRLLLSGSTLMLYTDGLVERRGRSIDDGMADLCARVATDMADLEVMCDGALGLVHSAASDDDVAVLAIRIHSLAGYALHVRRPAVPASIPETRRALHTWLTDNGVPEYDAFEILVATTEACSNVVAHAYGLDAGTVDLTTTLTGADLRIVVRDDGVWRSDPATNQHGGRGLHIMRSLMDRVEIVNGPGTEVRMERRLNGARRPE
jgi:anti-sigma regulatory factor (Ser/Thr protein kinase)